MSKVSLSSFGFATRGFFRHASKLIELWGPLIPLLCLSHSSVGFPSSLSSRDSWEIWSIELSSNHSVGFPRFHRENRRNQSRLNRVHSIGFTRFHREIQRILDWIEFKSLCWVYSLWPRELEKSRLNWVQITWSPRFHRENQRIFSIELSSNQLILS